MIGPFHTDECAIHDGDVDNDLPCDCGLVEFFDEPSNVSDGEAAIIRAHQQAK